MNSLGLEKMEADVLVIGGGLAGCWAAIEAKRRGAAVLLADKSKVSKGGCSTFACGNIACPLPEDDLAPWIDEITGVGCGLSDKAWVVASLTHIYHRVQEMEQFGVIFEKEGSRFVRTGGRGKLLKSVIAPGRPMMQAMRQQAEKLGVVVRDRTVILHLVVEEGRCLGAVGMDTRTGQFCLISARAVVLSAGGCAFGGTFYGNQDSTGDSHALAYKAGAEQTGFEFVGHNTTHRDYDTSGMGRFAGHGCRFLNGLGQPFMDQYNQYFGNRAPSWSVSLAMAREVEMGRGPIYLDLTGLTEEEYERFARIMPHMPLILRRAGINIRKDPMPWMPMSGTTYGMIAGCKIDACGQTNIAGLFAAGGAGSILRGASLGVTGAPLMCCCVSGQIAGGSAAEHALGCQFTPVDLGPVQRAREEMLAPLKRSDGINHHQLLAETQKAFIPYKVMLLKRADRLSVALGRILEIKEKFVPQAVAWDIHDLVKLWEVKNILLTAEMFLRASLARTESRAIHFREDFPEEDNKSWLKWLIIKEVKGEMSLRAEPVA